MNHYISTTELAELVGYEGKPDSFSRYLRRCADRYADRHPQWVKIWNLKIKVGRVYKFPLDKVREILG